jgi:hypothetical protein
MDWSGMGFLSDTGILGHFILKDKYLYKSREVTENNDLPNKLLKEITSFWRARICHTLTWHTTC